MGETTIQNDEYIHFPLCCLYFDKDLKKTADYLISYGIVERAGKLYDSSDDEALKDVGDYTLGVTIGSTQNIRKCAAAIQQHIFDYESKYGKDTRVRIHKTVLFEVRDGKFRFGVDGFRVLCAVKAAIGRRRQPIPIPIRRIELLSRGIRSEDVMNEFVEMDKLPPLLNRSKIRHLLDKLDRTFLAKVTVGNRQTYYVKNPKDHKMLIEYVATLKSKAQQRKDRRAQDQADIAGLMTEKLGYEWTQEKGGNVVPLIAEQTIEATLNYLHGDIVNS